MNRDKLELINRLWKCKNGEILTITANLSRKIDRLDGFRPLWQSRLVRMRKFRPLQEPIRLQDFLNSAHSRAEKSGIFSCQTEAVFKRTRLPSFTRHMKPYHFENALLSTAFLKDAVSFTFHRRRVNGRRKSIV